MEVAQDHHTHLRRKESQNVQALWFPPASVRAVGTACFQESDESADQGLGFSPGGTLVAGEGGGRMCCCLFLLDMVRRREGGRKEAALSDGS